MKISIINIRILLLVGILCSCSNTIFLGKQRIINIAKTYLSEKYEQEMDYLYSVHTWEPDIYRIYFSPKNRPDIIFAVYVDYDKKITFGRTNIYGNHFEPDNYLLMLFERDTEIFFKKILEREGITDIRVRENKSSLYSFQVPIEINEHMTTKEMEQYINYNVYIHSTDLFFSEINREEEANNILCIINQIEKTGYKPNEITFVYKITKPEMKKNNSLVDSVFISIKCYEVETSKEILDQINREASGF